MESRGGSGARATESHAASSPYKTSQESTSRPSYATRGSERAAPQYQTEERRPSYAKGDYFDRAPRATARKEPEYERVSRKTAHDTKEKSRVSTKETKGAEKERRREKDRKSERDTRRDRDRKYANYAEGSDSDSDEVARWQRKMREEDEQRKAKEDERQAAREYYEKVQRQQQEADEGAYHDERARKMFTASAQAQDYIRSSRTRPRTDSGRRPSPQRMGSSKNKSDYEYVKRSEGRPAAVRRGSERPKTTGRDTESSRKSNPREPERRLSAEKVEEPRRPPTLNQTRSSPADIHIPTDKQRSQSLQTDAEPVRDIPQVKRAETMPYGGLRRENTAPTKSSGLRQTEFNEGLATPATTPEYNGPSKDSTKYNYGRQYADDMEYPTPDGYKTEVREPREQGRNSRPTYSRKVTRSPSPIKDVREGRDSGDSREKSRTTSARYQTSPQPPPLNTRTTSYVYGGPGQGVEAYERAHPHSGRGTSPRDAQHLYGEIRPASGSPRQKYGPYSPPDEGVRYSRPIRPEDIKVQSGGYNYKRGSGDRPNLSRNGSGNPAYATARA